jgi:hypothetical protein
MKRLLVDSCIGAVLLGSVVLNVVLWIDGRPSGADVRDDTEAHSIGDRRPPRTICTKHLKIRTRGDGRVNGQEQQHSGFAGESRDATWATTQEGVLEAHLEQLLSPYRIDLAVECRMRCCEFSGDHVDWALVTSELQTSAGLVGWATEFSFGDQVVACFDRETAHRPPTDLVRRRNQILARSARDVATCGELSPVATAVAIRLAINVDGSVHSSTREGELSGSEAARCVEKRLLENADFDPRDEPALVQFVVALSPTQADPR